MAGLIDVDRLYSVGVVVRDLQAATRRYAEIFGIDEWDIRDFGPERLSNVNAYGRGDIQASFRTATGTVHPPAGFHSLFGEVATPVTFELVQPLTGETPFQEFRFRRGQGISHLTLSVQDAAAFGVLRDELMKFGLAIVNFFTVDGVLERHFIDTRQMLGGYLVEVQVPLSPAAQSTIAITERWNHAGTYARPDGIGPVTVSGVSHFGVVVNDVIAAINRYNEILGVESFGIKDWRTEPGRLENPYYRGKPVNHEYFTGLTPFRDFGLEIIQPTLGPSHYNREFRDLWGQGIHHMLLNITGNEAEWDATIAWLASADVPLAMGADLGPSAAFCYYDTFEALGGYILEGVLVRDVPTAGADGGGLAFDYTIDFAALTAKL